MIPPEAENTLPLPVWTVFGPSGKVPQGSKAGGGFPGEGSPLSCLPVPVSRSEPTERPLLKMLQPRSPPNVSSAPAGWGKDAGGWAEGRGRENRRKVAEAVRWGEEARLPLHSLKDHGTLGWGWRDRG